MCISPSSLTFPSMTSAQALPHTPPFQVEALAFILSLLTRTFAGALVLLSCAFLYAAQAVFYSDLDIRDVQDPDALRTFLVTRQDISSHTYPPHPCTHRLGCISYPAYSLGWITSAQSHPVPCDTILLFVYAISSLAIHVSLGTPSFIFSCRSMARPASSPSGSRFYSRQR